MKIHPRTNSLSHGGPAVVLTHVPMVSQQLTVIIKIEKLRKDSKLPTELLEE